MSEALWEEMLTVVEEHWSSGIIGLRDGSQLQGLPVSTLELIQSVLEWVPRVRDIENRTQEVK